MTKLPKASPRNRPPALGLRVLEICAGGGGQSLGLEQAGFAHAAAVEIDAAACQTLRFNRPDWDVRQDDVRAIDGREFRGIDLFAGGVPCPPFSIAGRQLGKDDERDLFPESLRLIAEAKPRAVLLENVRGFASAKFDDYRQGVQAQLRKLGYESDWRVLNASDYGVPQLRPRFLIVALRDGAMAHFQWPAPVSKVVTVGESLVDLMAENGWRGAKAWAKRANDIGPTVVGGSKKHGGPDLGPTRARAGWLELGVDGGTIALAAPSAADPVDLVPRLTVRMVARVQGFPDKWRFVGNKTAAYRQVGNAFPPPVARAVGEAIKRALDIQANAASELVAG